MDGTSKDRMVNGRLFRPLSSEQASIEYVDVVRLIAKSQYLIQRMKDVSGLEYFVIKDKLKKSYFQIIESDFIKCKNVAKKMGSFPIFPSEPVSDVNGRIAALLRVEFS